MVLTFLNLAAKLGRPLSKAEHRLYRPDWIELAGLGYSYLSISFPEIN